MTTWRRTLLILTVLLTALGGAVLPAAAQEEPPPTDGDQIVQSWALAPAGSGDPSQPGNRPNLSYTAAAGSSVQDAVTLYNYSNVPLTFRVYAADGFNTEDGGFDALAAGEASSDVGAWVTFDIEELTLAAGQQATIPITIDIPADADPGDHVGAVLASSRAEGTGPDGKAIALDRRTGTRLYLRVDGPLEPNLSVEGVSPSYDPSLNPLSGETTVTYTVVNRGNVRLGGQAHVSASGPFGLLEQRSETQELPELLPGESVTLTATVDGVPAGVLDTVSVHVDPAAVEGDVDSLESRSTGSLTLAIPYTVLALLLIAGLVWFAVRRYRRHQGRTTPPALPRVPGGPEGGAPGDGATTVSSKEHQPA